MLKFFLYVAAGEKTKVALVGVSNLLWIAKNRDYMETKFQEKKAETVSFRAISSFWLSNTWIYKGFFCQRLGVLHVKIESHNWDQDTRIKRDPINNTAKNQHN